MWNEWVSMRMLVSILIQCLLSNAYFKVLIISRFASIVQFYRLRFKFSFFFYLFVDSIEFYPYKCELKQCIIQRPQACFCARVCICWHFIRPGINRNAAFFVILLFIGIVVVMSPPSPSPLPYIQIRTLYI